MKIPGLNRPSLTLRLVLLAAVWSLAVLVVAGVALSLYFNYAVQSRFDRGLAEQIDNLSAGVGVDAYGAIVSPSLADTRTLRGFSGKYWSIAEPTPDGGLRELVRSVSLVDAAPLPPPPGGSETLAEHQGATEFYNATGPDNQRLRVGALQVRLPRRTAPVVLLAAEDSGPLQADSRRFALVTLTTLAAIGAGLATAGASGALAASSFLPQLARPAPVRPTRAIAETSHITRVILNSPNRTPNFRG